MCQSERVRRVRAVWRLDVREGLRWGGGRERVRRGVVAAQRPRVGRHPVPREHAGPAAAHARRPAAQPGPVQLVGGLARLQPVHLIGQRGVDGAEGRLAHQLRGVRRGQPRPGRNVHARLLLGQVERIGTVRVPVRFGDRSGGEERQQERRAELARCRLHGERELRAPVSADDNGRARVRGLAADGGGRGAPLARRGAQPQGRAPHTLGDEVVTCDLCPSPFLRT